jgi:hypothetical protein
VQALTIIKHFLHDRGFNNTPKKEHQKSKKLGQQCAQTKSPHIKFVFSLNMSLALGTFSLLFRSQKDTESNFKLVPERSWTWVPFSLFFEARKAASPTLNWYQNEVGLGLLFSSF